MKRLFLLKLRFSVGLIVACVGIVLALSMVLAQDVLAKNYSLDGLDVVIDVKEDSTMDISEEISYTFNDEMNGMFREITLDDLENSARCFENQFLQCGGFSFIDVTGVFVNGKEIPEGRYETFETTTMGEERLRVQYKFDNAPIYISGEKYTFKIEYTILGGIGFIENDALAGAGPDEYGLFYWDTIFPDRDKTIKKARVEVNYPGSVQVDTENSSVKTDSGQNYSVKTQMDNKKVVYELQNIEPYTDFTVLQKISLDDIQKPATLIPSLSPRTQFLSFDEYKIEIKDGQEIQGIPAGRTKLTFSADGYESQSLEINPEPGEELPLEVNLEMSPGRILLMGFLICCNCLLFILALLIPFGVYVLWSKKGRDPKTRETIIPEFSPPDDIRPYLLGSLKDETADNVDITATIIDLAVRGYIKIIEKEKSFFGLGSQDYTLKKIKDLDDGGLDSTEHKIASNIFDSSGEVDLSDLKNKFYVHLSSIQTSMYKKMISEGYFTDDPNSVRQKWLGVGIAVLVIGIVISVPLFMVGILTFILVGLIGGISLLVASRYMPAKTLKGAETLWRIRGFKMYLETAEKHMLQNLTPELFEEYLPYAMVFGIEEKWAEKFKDLYKEPPDWYVGRHPSTFNTILLANSLRNFNRTSASTITSRPSSSSSSGGGWSGGGGFSGGFSGGGGGGGGGGAW